jgi:hypothetical protein
MVQLTRDLVEILLQNLIVPPASGLGDVDGLMRALKKGIVSYVIDCGDAPKDALAKIFDKSDRWIYRQLEEMDTDREQRHLGEDHGGYELMLKAVEFYTQLYPREAPPQACVHALRRQKIDVVVQTLEPVLNLCVDQGYLTRVTIEVGGQKETVYRALGNGTIFGSASDLKDRKARVAMRSRSIFPLLRSYVEGHPLSRCMLINIGLPEDKIQTFVEKTRAYMIELLTQMTEETNREAKVSKDKSEHPEYRVMFLAGYGQFNDHPHGS